MTIRRGRPPREEAEAIVAAAMLRGARGEPVDPSVLVLVLGRYPEFPPAWALQQCAAIFQEALRGRPAEAPLIRLLDAMWDFFLDAHRAFLALSAESRPPEPFVPPSDRQAIRAAKVATGLSLSDEAIRKAWRKEQTGGAGGQFSFLGLKDTPRGLRALKRRTVPSEPWRTSRQEK